MRRDAELKILCFINSKVMRVEKGRVRVTLSLGRVVRDESTTEGRGGTGGLQLGVTLDQRKCEIVVHLINVPRIDHR